MEVSMITAGIRTSESCITSCMKNGKQEANAMMKTTNTIILTKNASTFERNTT